MGLTVFIDDPAEAERLWNRTQELVKAGRAVEVKLPTNLKVPSSEKRSNDDKPR